MSALSAISPELVPIRNAALGMLAAATACAVFAPALFWLLLAGVAAAGLLFLTWRHLVAVTAVWLLVTGLTLEMVLSDLIGPAAFQPIIAVVKAAGLLLAVLAMLRYGPRLDLFNPALAWTAMFVGGLVHGLWPDLSTGESLRSLAGSAAPFMFGFSQLSEAWAAGIIRTTRWIPLVGVLAGAALAAAGLHPLFIQSGGARLAGLSHPAFLAGICQAAIYAGLLQYYRSGRRGELALLGVNLLLLLLTGARAPLACASAVVGWSFACVQSPAASAQRRWMLILAGLATLPLLVVLALGLLPADFSAIRTFHVLANDADNLSGRQLLWPNFEQAAAGSPWLGWGVGAGNAIIPSNSEVAELLHTWAAHNEYLRIAVEGGQFGRALLIVMMVLWVRGHTATLPRFERQIMRLVFVGLAVHAFTDNVLISSPACVLFAFATAVFARGRWESASATRSAPCSGRNAARAALPPGLLSKR